MDSNIPKRIIQTGRSLDLPILFKAASANVKLFNPEYEYLFFEDEKVNAFVDQHFKKYREIFDSFPYPIQKYDFFRYLAIYHYGGFYFDLDVLLSSPLPELPASTCLFPFESITVNSYLRNQLGMEYEIGNYAFGASPGHPFIQAIIENCVRAQKEPKWVEDLMKGLPRFMRAECYVLYSTGPGLVTRTLAENKEFFKSVTVLFPENIYDQKQWHQFGKYGTHLMEGKWRKHNGWILRKISSMWESRVLRKYLKGHE